MPFTVTWADPAIQELARLWNQASDRQAVTDAADAIDDNLRNRPLLVGVPVGIFRRLTIQPLEVLYGVSPPDCLVQVLWVRRANP